jgi:hypothetical protein
MSTPLPCSLLELPLRLPARVVAIEPSAAEDCGREGLCHGSTVEIVARAPLGGALVVRLGRARIAVPQPIATRVVVQPLPERPTS